MGFEEDVRSIMSHFKVSYSARVILVAADNEKSINGKLCCSPLRCRGKSKISPLSH